MEGGEGGEAGEGPLNEERQARRNREYGLEARNLERLHCLPPGLNFAACAFLDNSISELMIAGTPGTAPESQSDQQVPTGCSYCR